MSNGGRVTTREFYDALLDQNKSRADMEIRILDRLDDITSSQSAAEERFKSQDKRITTNTADIKKVGGVNAFLAVIGSTIATLLGTRQ